MPNPTGSSAGESDATFIYRVREQIEDMPRLAVESVAGNASQTEYQMTQIPVYDGDIYNPSSGAVQFVVQVAGAVQALVADPSLLTTTGQVAIDYEAGWIYWNPGNPPSGQIVVRKRKVRWRDQRILEALNAGLKAMFPAVWQDQYDTSITLRGLDDNCEYTLPNVFWDPRVRILAVEVQDLPAALERFHHATWSRPNLTTIRVPSSASFTPGSVLRIRYAGPYGALSDLEPQIQQLPIHYCKALLLSNKEIQRVRQDTANITQADNANPVGANQNAGAYFMQLFNAELQRMARPMPVARPVTVYGIA